MAQVMYRYQGADDEDSSTTGTGPSGPGSLRMTARGESPILSPRSDDDAPLPARGVPHGVVVPPQTLRRVQSPPDTVAVSPSKRQFRVPSAIPTIDLPQPGYGHGPRGAPPAAADGAPLERTATAVGPNLLSGSPRGDRGTMRSFRFPLSDRTNQDNQDTDRKPSSSGRTAAPMPAHYARANEWSAPGTARSRDSHRGRAGELERQWSLSQLLLARTDTARTTGSTGPTSASATARTALNLSRTVAQAPDTPLRSSGAAAPGGAVRVDHPKRGEAETEATAPPAAASAPEDSGVAKGPVDFVAMLREARLRELYGDEGAAAAREAPAKGAPPRKDKRTPAPDTGISAVGAAPDPATAAVQAIAARSRDGGASGHPPLMELLRPTLLARGIVRPSPADVAGAAQRRLSGPDGGPTARGASLMPCPSAPGSARSPPTLDRTAPRSGSLLERSDRGSGAGTPRQLFADPSAADSARDTARGRRRHLSASGLRDLLLASGVGADARADAALASAGGMSSTAAALQPSLAAAEGDALRLRHEAAAARSEAAEVAAAAAALRSAPEQDEIRAIREQAADAFFADAESAHQTEMAALRDELEGRAPMGDVEARTRIAELDQRWADQVDVHRSLNMAGRDAHRLYEQMRAERQAAELEAKQRRQQEWAQHLQETQQRVFAPFGGTGTHLSPQCAAPHHADPMGGMAPNIAPPSTSGDDAKDAKDAKAGKKDPPAEDKAPSGSESEGKAAPNALLAKVQAIAAGLATKKKEEAERAAREAEEAKEAKKGKKKRPESPPPPPVKALPEGTVRAPRADATTGPTTLTQAARDAARKEGKRATVTIVRPATPPRLHTKRVKVVKKPPPGTTPRGRGVSPGASMAHSGADWPPLAPASGARPTPGRGDASVRTAVSMEYSMDDFDSRAQSVPDEARSPGGGSVLSFQRSSESPRSTPRVRVVYGDRYRPPSDLAPTTASSSWDSRTYRTDTDSIRYANSSSPYTSGSVVTRSLDYDSSIEDSYGSTATPLPRRGGRRDTREFRGAGGGGGRAPMVPTDAVHRLDAVCRAAEIALRHAVQTASAPATMPPDLGLGSTAATPRGHRGEALGTPRGDLNVVRPGVGGRGGGGGGASNRRSLPDTAEGQRLRDFLRQAKKRLLLLEKKRLEAEQKKRQKLLAKQAERVKRAMRRVQRGKALRGVLDDEDMVDAFDGNAFDGVDDMVGGLGGDSDDMMEDLIDDIDMGSDYGSDGFGSDDMDDEMLDEFSDMDDMDDMDMEDDMEDDMLDEFEDDFEHSGQQEAVDDGMAESIHSGDSGGHSASGRRHLYRRKTTGFYADEVVDDSMVDAMTASQLNAWDGGPIAPRSPAVDEDIRNGSDASFDSFRTDDSASDAPRARRDSQGYQQRTGGGAQHRLSMSRHVVRRDGGGLDSSRRSADQYDTSFSAGGSFRDSSPRPEVEENRLRRRGRHSPASVVGSVADVVSSDTERSSLGPRRRSVARTAKGGGDDGARSVATASVDSGSFGGSPRPSTVRTASSRSRSWASRSRSRSVSTRSRSRSFSSSRSGSTTPSRRRHRAPKSRPVPGTPGSSSGSHYDSAGRGYADERKGTAKRRHPGRTSSPTSSSSGQLRASDFDSPSEQHSTSDADVDRRPGPRERRLMRYDGKGPSRRPRQPGECESGSDRRGDVPSSASSSDRTTTTEMASSIDGRAALALTHVRDAAGTKREAKLRKLRRRWLHTLEVPTFSELHADPVNDSPPSLSESSLDDMYGRHAMERYVAFQDGSSGRPQAAKKASTGKGPQPSGKEGRSKGTAGQADARPKSATEGRYDAVERAIAERFGQYTSRTGGDDADLEAYLRRRGEETAALSRRASGPLIEHLPPHHLPRHDALDIHSRVPSSSPGTSTVSSAASSASSGTKVAKSAAVAAQQQRRQRRADARHRRSEPPVRHGSRSHSLSAAHTSPHASGARRRSGSVAGPGSAGGATGFGVTQQQLDMAHAAEVVVLAHPELFSGSTREESAAALASAATALTEGDAPMTPPGARRSSSQPPDAALMSSLAAAAAHATSRRDSAAVTPRHGQFSPAASIGPQGSQRKLPPLHGASPAPTSARSLHREASASVSAAAAAAAMITAMSDAGSHRVHSHDDSLASSMHREAPNSARPASHTVMTSAATSARPRSPLSLRRTPSAPLSPRLHHHTDSSSLRSSPRVVSRTPTRSTSPALSPASRSPMSLLSSRPHSRPESRSRSRRLSVPGPLDLKVLQEGGGGGPSPGVVQPPTPVVPEDTTPKSDEPLVEVVPQSDLDTTPVAPAAPLVRLPPELGDVAPTGSPAAAPPSQGSAEAEDDSEEKERQRAARDAARKKREREEERRRKADLAAQVDMVQDPVAIAAWGRAETAAASQLRGVAPEAGPASVWAPASSSSSSPARDDDVKTVSLSLRRERRAATEHASPGGEEAEAASTVGTAAALVPAGATAAELKAQETEVNQEVQSRWASLEATLSRFTLSAGLDRAADGRPAADSWSHTTYTDSDLYSTGSSLAGEGSDDDGTDDDIW